jgi:hypothetical protein
VLAALLAVTGACGTDSGPEPAPIESFLSPSGTPLSAGLEVPVGTQLVGPVFAEGLHEGLLLYGASAEVVSHQAVLQVDGDPFAAWDDLAGQAQAIGVRIAGSGTCMWRLARAPQGMDHIPNVDTPVALSRPDLADTLDCEAAARAPLPDGSMVMIEMRLWWWAEGAELHVRISQGDVSGADTPQGYGSSSELSASYPETDPGPAPATAGGQLPERGAPTSIGRGDPFGAETDCFETRYDSLTVPAGARFVGGGTTPGLGSAATVLAVDDPEAVLGELRNQLDRPDDSNGHFDIGEERLEDGTSIWVLSVSVDAGGGACAMRSSPDGTAVLVST